MSYPPWYDFAACKGRLDIFCPDPEKRNAAAAADLQAKRICATCPVIDQCRRWALDRPEHFGTWGGLTEKERAAMNCAGRSSIGESGRYMAHRRHGEPICDTCRAGHNERTQKLRARAQAAQPATKLPVMWWRPTVSRSA